MIVCADVGLKGSPVESAINKHGDPCIRWSSQGMLRLAPEAMKRLFHSTLERIKQAIGDVLNTVKGPSNQQICFVLLSVFLGAGS